MGSETTTAWMKDVAERARRADVFDAVDAAPGGIICRARHVESEATYRVSVEGSSGRTAWVGLYTPDRWLSESIEAELMHVGDKIEDLLEEELVDQGYPGGRLAVEHFRDDQKQFVFRSPVATTGGDAAERVALALLAYRACFGELGDMKPADETA